MFTEFRVEGLVFRDFERRCERYRHLQMEVACQKETLFDIIPNSVFSVDFCDSVFFLFRVEGLVFSDFDLFP